MYWLDYIIIISTLIIYLIIGVYYHVCKGGQHTTENYLMGNRNLQLFPTAVSIFVSFASGTTILGWNAEMYYYGAQGGLIGFARIPMLFVTVALFVPIYHRLQITSIFEYHRKRYQCNILERFCITLKFISGMIFMAVTLYAPAVALGLVTGLPIWVSIITTGLVAAIYTSMGGIKAVIWTDLVQAGFMLVGMLIIIAIGVRKVGGINEVFYIAKEKGRLFINTDPDPTKRITLWSVFIGVGTFSLTNVAGDQMTVQRYCAVPTLRGAYIVTLLQIPLIIVASSLYSLCGLVVFAYYDTIGCDPFRSHAISSTNQILPYYIEHAVSVNGLTGLLIVVLYSGALSTISSVMNSMATIIWKGFLDKRFQNITETKQTLVTKLLTLVFASIGMAIAFLMKYFQGHIMQFTMSVLAGSAGPMVGVIIAGMLFPCVHSRGAIIGLSCGLGVFLTITYGQVVKYPFKSYLYTNIDNCTFHGNVTARIIPEDDTDTWWIFRISYQYIPLAGLLTTVTVALVVSIILKKGHTVNIDSNLFINWGDVCACFMPETCRRPNKEKVDVQCDGSLLDGIQENKEQITHID